MALLGLVVAAGACVSTEVAWVGSQTAGPAIPTEQVQIYDRERDLPAGSVTMAVLYLGGPGNPAEMATVLDELRKRAAEIGANAIVVREFTDPLTDTELADAYVGTPVDRRGRALAVRLPD